ncbi:MAG: hypothetical protein WCC10_14045 [Tumebacillaceae bacterium]
MANENDMKSKKKTERKKFAFPSWLAPVGTAFSFIGDVAKAFYWIFRLFKD